MTQPDPSAQSGVPDPNAGQSAGTTGVDGSSTTTTQPEGAPSGTTTTAETTPATVSQADFDRVVTQLRAADQNRSKAEQALQQLRDKDIPEMDRLKRDNQALTEQIDRLKDNDKKNAVKLAFFAENSVKWHDAAAALQLADMSNVVINDDGTVTGLKKALEDLAKAKPYLVDKGTQEQPDNTGNAGTAGAPPMNGRPGTTKPDTNALVSRIPALGSRRRPTR